MSQAPACIAFIMDGNRRFAREKGIVLLEGHRQGFEKLKEVIEWSGERGVGYLIVYAFSTENWNRAPEEVSYLMNLFTYVLEHEVEVLHKRGVRIRCIGERSRFTPKIQALMENAEKKTADGKTITLVLALSYGGRAEILAAANKALNSGVGEITEETFSSYLWTSGIPDPDLIVRTSGEQRLSGFLPWQGVYSELVFTETLWPALTKGEFASIIDDYSKRNRRMGR